jgi:flagellar hook-length control protein FliK
MPNTFDTTVATPLHQPGFAPALGTRITTLIKDGIERASIRLNPAEMGPVAVQLALEGTQVRVEMSADMAATRQVLEQALPSLASAMKDAGFTLTGGGVFQQPQDRQDANDRAMGNPSSGMATDGTDAALDAVSAGRGPARPQGLVDLFA